MKIDDALIDRLSTLSKLSYEGAEREQIKVDLERMLDLCDMLQEVDTDGVEPLIYMTDEKNRLREDVVDSDITQEEALKNAPSKDAYYFKVPTVIAGEG
jgi:aspartyl-tRNA(Asn)/glutamyl-tRNA(Gln) amidotransferase subunit C